MSHVKNVEIRSRQNPEDGPTRQFNQNIQIVGERTLNITSFVWILREVYHNGRTNFRKIDEPQDRIIATSNKSTNLKDWITETSNKSTNPKDWNIETSKESISRIRMHKPLKLQKPYTYAHGALRAEDVSVRTSRLKRKIRIHTHKPLKAQNYTTYANPHTYTQAA